MTQERCDCANSARTGFVRPTMPVQHERRCPDCGVTFWAIPAQLGASFTRLANQESQQ
jgi:hypothetical protein